MHVSGSVPGRRAVAACVAGVVALAAGCGPGGAPPAPFAPGDAIPLGVVTLRVVGLESVPPSPTVLSSLSAPAGEKAIVALVRWSGLDAYSEGDRGIFLRSFLRARIRVRDSDGFEYRAITAMPRESYLLLPPTRPAPPDWVVVFHVWVDSRGYTLLLEHPDPRTGAFRVASVELP